MAVDLVHAEMVRIAADQVYFIGLEETMQGRLCKRKPDEMRAQIAALEMAAEESSNYGPGKVDPMVTRREPEADMPVSLADENH